MAIRLVKKISTFFMDPAGDVSQQSFFVLTSSPMKGMLKLCPQNRLRQLHASANTVSTTHWLPDTRHFARDFIAELALCDPTLAKAPPTESAREETEDEQRKAMWTQIIGKPPDWL
jgi:hypothetical protein